MPELLGIHHVTGLAGEAQANLDFYTGLGLRLVKRTVNFDDPGTYHLYYGDRAGRPGSILTFFPYGPRVRRGRPGPGQVESTTLSLPAGALAEWADRLREKGVEAGEGERFGVPTLPLADPDGMALELVAAPTAGEGSAEPALRGATLAVRDPDRTLELLVHLLGFREAGAEGDRVRVEVGSGAATGWLEVRPAGGPEGVVAGGSVHHIALRAADDAMQEAWRAALVDRGLHLSPVMDRQYFRSLYFREPGGVLFEIATDPPGFTADEPESELGRGLMLPPWLERSRPEIEAGLPALRLPGAARSAA